MHPFNRIIRDIEIKAEKLQEQVDKAVLHFYNSVKCSHHFNKYDRNCTKCNVSRLHAYSNHAMLRELQQDGKTVIQGKVYYSIEDYYKDYYARLSIQTD